MFIQTAVAVVVAFAPVQAEPLVGRWEGVLATPDGQFIPVVLRVSKGADGEVTAVADSPMHGDMDRPVTELTLVDGVFRMTISGLPGRYEGRLEGETLTGVWIEDEAEMSLNLTRQPG